MEEAGDRRAQKKAQTRQDVKLAAQRLFTQRGFDAVTIADVAAAADVAVQTVFNHFSTKEELYFADRARWVDCPARAVTARRPGTGAMATVQSWLCHHVLAYPTLMERSARQNYVENLMASPALRMHEQELIRRCERLLSRALVQAWTEQLGPDVPGLRLPADLVGGMLVTAGRVMVAEQRQFVRGPDPSAQLRAEVEGLTFGVVEAIGAGVQLVAARPDAPRALQLMAALERDLPADEDVAVQFVPPGPVGTTDPPA